MWQGKRESKGSAGAGGGTFQKVGPKPSQNRSAVSEKTKSVWPRTGPMGSCERGPGPKWAGRVPVGAAGVLRSALKTNGGRPGRGGGLPQRQEARSPRRSRGSGQPNWANTPRPRAKRPVRGLGTEPHPVGTPWGNLAGKSGGGATGPRIKRRRSGNEVWSLGCRATQQKGPGKTRREEPNWNQSAAWRQASDGNAWGSGARGRSVRPVEGPGRAPWRKRALARASAKPGGWEKCRGGKSGDRGPKSAEGAGSGSVPPSSWEGAGGNRASPDITPKPAGPG